MITIIEWMIKCGIAQNGFQAAHISAGLNLPKYDRETQEKMCLLYRRWRPKTDKKNMLPTYQCYDLVIAGIEPENVEERQIEMFEAVEMAAECE